MGEKYVPIGGKFWLDTNAIITKEKVSPQHHHIEYIKMTMQNRSGSQKVASPIA
jgi:hypothetical protein